MTRSGAEIPIERITAAAFTVPTDAPESDGTLEWDATTIVVVMACAAGVEGLGYTYAHGSAAAIVSDLLADVVRGMDALDVGAAAAAMVHEVRNLGATGLVAEAVSAVDIALWDLKARLLEIPLSVALDAVRAAAPVYGSGGFTSYDDTRLARQLAAWVAAGIPRVKIKTGRDPAADPERLRVARKTIGDDVELFVDANGAFAVQAALEWAQIYRGEFGVRWFEEPVSSDDVRGLRRVRDGAPAGLDITAGEYAWSPRDAVRLLDGEAVDVLQLDVTRCLGITGFLTGAAAAAARQLDVSAHCAPQVSAHVGCAVPRFRHLEYFHDHVRVESLLFDGVLRPDASGSLRPDRSVAGHGLTLKRADAARFAMA